MTGTPEAPHGPPSTSTSTSTSTRRRGRPAAHERESRRAELLHAATTTFLAHGYAATTIDQIAAAAQVTKRTVYTYVGDKAAVFTAVVDQLHHDVLAAASAGITPDGSPDDHPRPAGPSRPAGSAGPSAPNGTDGATSATELLDLCTRIVETLHSDHGIGLHRLVIAEAPTFPDLAATFYATGPQRYVVALADAITRCRATGVVAEGDPTIPLGAGERLFGLLLGEAHRRRLLCLEPAPTEPQARAHARDALGALGLPGRLEA